MDLEAQIAQLSFSILLVASVLLAVLATIALHTKHPSDHLKQFLFSSIIAAVVLPTLYLIGSTIYLNATSSSKGPVHWHADIEIWQCGQEVQLKDPEGVLSNKIGTATLHEHNDKRIHLEGVVVHPEDASLGKFFRVIDGSITADSVVVPSTNGQVTLKNGSTCPDGQVGEVQVFAIQTDNEQYYSQKKVSDPAQYLMSPYSVVPQGDCIIVEFGPVKERTDKLCRSYQVAEKIGKLKGERR
jgi:hypothetical protein